MQKLIVAAALALLASSSAYSETAAPGTARLLTSVPADSGTVTNYYKQNVYDPSDNKIGEIVDVLVDQEGRVNALIIGVGGFLGLGEKNVAVDYGFLEKNGAITPSRITLNMTEQDLRAAPSFVRLGSSSTGSSSSSK